MTDPLEAALLPCPFCGSADVKLRKDDVCYLSPSFHFVLCRSCSAAGGNDDTPDMATERWNRRALLAREQAAGWQPIETAPRDGTRVLTYSPTAASRWWRVTILRWHQPANPEAKGFWTGERKVQPTHWQPLPAPPALPAKEPT